MKLIKWFLFTIVFVFIFLIIACTGGYLLIGNTTLVALVTKGIESSTGTRIYYQKDAKITRTLSPVLSIKNLILEDGDKQFTIHSNSLKLQVSLPGLLFGKLKIPMLVLGDTRVELQESTPAKKLVPPKSFPLKPILNDIQISKISVISENQEFSLPGTNINKFIVKIEPDADKLICTMEAEHEGSTFDIIFTLPRIQKTLELQALPFSLNVKNTSLSMSTEGLIDFSSSSATIEAMIQGNVSRLPSFFAEGPEPLKSINFSTQISGE